MSEAIDIGQITEALNDKMDRDVGNPATLGKSRMSSFGMPSTYETFTIGTSASEHTATANGYIYVKTSNAVTWIGVGVYSGNDYTAWDYYCDANDVSSTKTLLVPVLKGKKFFIGYPSGTTFETARFFYAEGEV